MNNRLVIAAAGAGKTTYLIDEAIKRAGRVLITTYTRSNLDEIKRKIYHKYGCVPQNIEIHTWFEFLLRQGVRPFQGNMSDFLYERRIGFFLTNKQSAMYTEEANTLDHYFDEQLKIYSDKIAKFIVKCNEKSNGVIINRIENIYSHIFIDEIQDMVGYDLEILQLLIYSNIELIMVGDPRQTTYSTHQTNKYTKYQDGKIEKFFKDIINKKKKNCEIDLKTLNRSHRNNRILCDFSSKLFPYLPKTEECTCIACRNYDQNEHSGVFLLYKKDASDYLEKYRPVQLRWNVTTKGNVNYPIHNFGESKGQSFDRVIIYPTKDIISWIENHDNELKDQTRAKFYVAITRARKSCAIVVDDNICVDNIGDECCIYKP